MRLFGLIGYPLTHSFSKKYFTEKFEKEGLDDCRYELFPIESITELPGLISQHPDLEGLNITIPYKKQVLPYLNHTAFIPAGLEACNCILFSEGQLIGYNTDVVGFRESLRPVLRPDQQSALVLGNGGATAAVIFALQQLGISYHIVSRALQPGSDFTYQDLDHSIIQSHPIIINTTPVGMYPKEDHCPDIPYESIDERHLLFDLVYNPAQTLFLRKGAERGATIKNGEDMLLLQAEESWKIWNSI
ncbi:MAG: shikimate dehydrogenase [Chitinophagaceae bacterium]|nr:shikimate dehydrogenase [Chitinophagaceae bacterium]MBP6589719.1 shikimate dehydrogenase [Chitinophagaceae bacterium]